MAPHAHDDHALLASPGSTHRTHIDPGHYELFRRRAPIFLSQLCFSGLLCSLVGWPWLGMAFIAFSVLVLLGVALAEYLRI